MQLTGGSAEPAAAGRLAAGDRSAPALRPFNPTRWFALLSLASIGLVAAVSAMLLSRMWIDQFLRRDAEVSMAFVQTLTSSVGADSYFQEPVAAPDARRIEQFFERITTMPDVLRANVYSRDGTVIWSSDAATVGKRFDFNPERDAALAGNLKIEAEILEHRAYVKPEHILAGPQLGDFVENYIPVWDSGQRNVIGVVELYKQPRPLYATIRHGVRLIWLCAALGGAFLFLALFWIVRRAHRVIERQAEQLAASESFAAIGEMTATVAHGIRNPLSSIRSSAELLAETRDAVSGEHCADIMNEVDRIEQGVRSLVSYAQLPNPGGRAPLNAVARGAIGEFSRDIDRQQVRVDWRLDADDPVVVGDAPLLQQVLASIVANALQAMPGGGTLSVTTATNSGRVDLSIADTGVGMSPTQLENIFVPFRSTKSYGLGVGLPLVRRVLLRFGGDISMSSEIGRGTTTTLHLRAG